MPPSMDTPDEIATVIVAVVVALGTITGGVVAAAVLGLTWWRAHIGPMLRGTAADAARTRAEVSANHGTSMRDAVSRLEVTVSALASLPEQVAQVGRDVRYLRGDMRSQQDSNDEIHEDLRARLRVLESPPPERD